MPRRRHHPTHAQGGAEFGRLARPPLAGAEHLLQSDRVGVELGEHRGDALRHGARVHAAAAMHVVGRHPQRAVR
jgi:hypothetical protein